METKKKYTVKLNNIDKIEQLLQETYNLACQQNKQLQDEINKISSTTTVNELDIDGKEKYAKIMNNFITSQQKSIAQKFDIAKLMAEVVKFGGDVNKAVNEMKGGSGTLDLDKLRKLAQEASTKSEERQEYKIKD